MSIKETNPWKTNSSDIVYENAWIRVREDKVVRPDGKPGIYGVVHYKNIAVGVLPVDEEGFVYLVGQHRYPLDEYSWEIPEGGCPEGEEPLLAAKRELEEETGMTAANWQFMGKAHLSNSVSDEGAVWYVATGLTHGKANPEGTEQLQHRRVSLQEALNMVANGKITDAVSMLAILTYATVKSR